MHGLPSSASIWVPTYVQQRNLSCEYAALVMAMGAYGVGVSEYEFDNLVGWSENPHWGYGKIEGELIKLGFTVSRTTIPKTLRRHNILPHLFVGDPSAGVT